MQDLVRETVANVLARQTPERYRALRRRAWRISSAASRTKADLWQCTADLLYLIENPIVRNAFFPPGASDFVIERASPADADALRDIAAATDTSEMARSLMQWWKAHPETFHVAKGRDGVVVAFYTIFEPDHVDQRLLESDLVTGAWLQHLGAQPVAAGERVLFLLRWLARETGEAPSAAQGACWLDIKRTYMELRPDLRRQYTTVVDLPTYAPIVTPHGFVPLEQANVTLGGITYCSALLDFGPGSVDGWLTKLIGAELGTDDEQDTRPTEGTATILFADIANSTALTEQMGDAAFRAAARLLDGSLREAIRQAGGTPIDGKLLGDGVLATFPFARQALEAALKCASLGDHAALPLHLGLHAGDVIREDNDIYGGAVNVAARISSLTSPGEVLVSDLVRGLGRTSAGVAFEDLGERELKGVGEPVRIFAVRSTT
jgi:class 3 adenylate cyclase